MQFELIRTLDEWDALGAEWPVAAVPFLRCDYLRGWWQTLGHCGEWPHSEPCIVTARENGRLIGIAPLFASVTKDDEPVLAFLGSDELSDYLDVLVPNDRLCEFLTGTLKLLKTQSPWQSIELYNLRDDSPTMVLLPEAANAAGLAFSREQIVACSRLPLPQSWDDYLASLVKKQRHELQRKLRRAESSQWYFADLAELDAEIVTLLNLMRLHGEKAESLTAGREEHLQRTMQIAAESGWLRLACLDIDGKRAAMYLLFDDANAIWVYNSGVDPAFRALSPGIVLLGQVIRWAIENQREAIEFLRGDEPYKRDLGAIVQPLWQVSLRR